MTGTLQLISFFDAMQHETLEEIQLLIHSKSVEVERGPFEQFCELDIYSSSKLLLSNLG